MILTEPPKLTNVCFPKACSGAEPQHLVTAQGQVSPLPVQPLIALRHLVLVHITHMEVFHCVEMPQFLLLWFVFFLQNVTFKCRLDESTESSATFLRLHMFQHVAPCNISHCCKHRTR